MTEEVFIDILQANKETIYRICNCYSKNTEDAKDLFQEVLYNIWRSLPSFNSKASVNTWVYRVTLNVCLRAKYEKQKRDRRFVNTGSIVLENLPVEADEPGNGNQFAHLYACVQALEDTEKSIILLFLEDMPYKEIAAITGLTENHIAVKIKRIKNKLSTCLKS